MEQYLSSPEQEHQSCYHEMMPTTIDSNIIIVDNFAAEYDVNVSDTGLQNAESPQLLIPQGTSILDGVSLLDHDWEHATVVSGIMSMFCVFSC